MSSFTDSAKKKWRKLMGEEEEEDDDLLGSIKNDAQDCCNNNCGLTRKQRLYGFAICFVTGFAVSFLGVMLLLGAHIKGFAICYSIGTLCALSSSCFLWGPWSQIKSMFKEYRWLATTVMLIFLALTICAAVWWKKTGLAIVFVICQFLAYLWYCLSYIPFARKIVLKCFEGCCSPEA